MHIWSKIKLTCDKNQYICIVNTRYKIHIKTPKDCEIVYCSNKYNIYKCDLCDVKNILYYSSSIKRGSEIICKFSDHALLSELSVEILCNLPYKLCDYTITDHLGTGNEGVVFRSNELAIKIYKKKDNRMHKFIEMQHYCFVNKIINMMKYNDVDIIVTFYFKDTLHDDIYNEMGDIHTYKYVKQYLCNYDKKNLTKLLDQYKLLKILKIDLNEKNIIIYNKKLVLIDV